MNVAFSKSDGAAAPRQIRFVHNQGQPPSKRRRINAACLTCRRRKTRCDGERPTCSTCTKNGHKCLGYPEDIKREGGDGHDTKLDDIDDAHAASQFDPDADTKPVHVQDRPGVPGIPEASRHVDPPASASHGSADSRPFQSPQEYHAKLAVPSTELPESSLALSNSRPPPTASTDDTHDLPSSPTLRRAQNLSHRIPYFRYFGATAIVPGFKQMVVSVRDRRMSASGSHSAASPLSTPSGAIPSGSAAGSDVVVEELPSYDPNSAGPVPSLITHLIKTFFLHVGCNFPFLREAKLLRMVKEKRVESILVDAICALASRFSDAPALTGGNGKMPRTERGQVFAQRAKLATVDTFPCPSVAAVQACLLMAYEGFGANQDSALWMYLGLAIRMAVDLGLQKRVGIKYQGEKDPWNTRQRSRVPGDPDSPEERRRDELDYVTIEEQKELEQERIDTFWAVFVLDRIISSGTGRPVTFRDDDFELPFPEAGIDPSTGWPALFPVLVQIIHLYGRVSDVLNNIHNADDLNQDTWTKLTSMEHQLTRLYKSWNARLQFSVNNFKAYLNFGQGNIFILLHFWFHALFIILHQPTLLTAFGELRSELQLLSDSRELSMSSAKTICDILAFADLIDPKSFIGNPFTSQPIYIAAGAFLMESSANASEGPSREPSPPPERKAKENGPGRHSRHSLLASAASQNYQRCYNSLQQIHNYWGGIKYILTALDQKAKGTRDVETYTTEEYESTKAAAQPRGSISGQLARLNSPKAGGPPIAWSLSGTANSPNSSLTLMYQTGNGSVVPSAARHPHAARQASTPPGNMVYDPIRQSLPEASGMFPPAVPQPNISALRHSPHQHAARRATNMPTPNGQPSLGYEGISDDAEGPKMFVPPGYTPTSQHSGGYDAYSGSPASALGENGAPTGSSNMYYGHGMPYSQGSWGAVMGNMDITFNSQDIDIGALGLNQPDLMGGGWLDYIPNDMLGLFESPEMNQNPGGSGGAGNGGHGSS